MIPILRIVAMIEDLAKNLPDPLDELGKAKGTTSGEVSGCLFGHGTSNEIILRFYSTALRNTL
jgi:hypothetical protein